MKVTRRLIASAAVALALVGCEGGDMRGGAEEGKKEGDKPAVESKTILIGEYGSLTGSEATFGQSTHNGIELAIKERNAAGGIDGKQVELKTYDDQGKSQEAGSAVTRLITEDKVVAILGEVQSSLSIAGGRVAQQYGVPMITPSSTNPQVTAIGDMVFRVCFLDSFQGYVVARFARDHLKISKVAVLYDQASAYSKGLKDFFSQEFTAMGGSIVADQAYTASDQDFSAQLTTIRAANPEAIFIPGYYNDVGNIAMQARKLGITATLLGGDGWESPTLATVAGADIEGSYYANHYTQQDARPEVQTFVTKYKDAYGVVPDSMAALSYDAARITMDAIDRADSTDGKAVAAQIAKTVDFPGVTGKITIDAERNARKTAVVVQMKGGQPVYVVDVEPADASASAQPPQPTQPAQPPP